MIRFLALFRTPSRRLPGMALLVLGLLWAQLLGLSHSVLHVPGVQVPVLAAAGPDQHAHEAHGLLAHLLAPADEAGECPLYDQLGHGGPAASTQIVLPTALPRLPTWAVLQALQPRPCAAFAARAPPASR